MANVVIRTRTLSYWKVRGSNLNEGNSIFSFSFKFELLDKMFLWNSEFAFEIFSCQAIIKNSEFDILGVRSIMETETPPSRDFINLTTVRGNDLEQKKIQVVVISILSEEAGESIKAEEQ